MTLDGALRKGRAHVELDLTAVQGQNMDVEQSVNEAFYSRTLCRAELSRAAILVVYMPNNCLYGASMLQLIILTGNGCESSTIATLATSHGSQEAMRSQLPHVAFPLGVAAICKQTYLTILVRW